MIAERFLDFVPFGDAIHARLNRAASAQYRHVIRAMAHDKVQRWRYYVDNTGAGLHNAKVIDVGTGWTGNDLILMHLLGASEIHTVDRYPNLNLVCIQTSVDGFREQETALLELGIPEPGQA